MKLNMNQWTQKEDNLLKSTVFKHVKEGSTQIKAFEEAGEKLGRTSAACGFRFNSIVKPTCKDEFEAVKEQRLSLIRKQKTAINEIVKDDDKTSNEERELIILEEKRNVSLESIMKDIKTLVDNNNKKDEWEAEREDLLREMMVLKTENAELKEKLSGVSGLFSMLKDLNL